MLTSRALLLKALKANARVDAYFPRLALIHIDTPSMKERCR